MVDGSQADHGDRVVPVTGDGVLHLSANMHAAHWRTLVLVRGMDVLWVRLLLFCRWVAAFWCTPCWTALLDFIYKSVLFYPCWTAAALCELSGLMSLVEDLGQFSFSHLSIRWLQSPFKRGPAGPLLTSLVPSRVTERRWIFYDFLKFWSFTAFC